MTELTTVETWESLLAESGSRPFMIFKHSTRCPISASALQRIHSFLASSREEAVPFYQVNVIESRALSNAIAQAVAVEHKSPQAILVKAGRAVWSTSHHAITQASLKEAVELYAAG